MIQTYLKEIAKAPKLSAKEEIELATKAKAGDIRSRNKLVESNLKFAVNIAKKFNGSSLPFEDLIAAASAGLITAADKYDPTYGVKFITFGVHWIKSAVHNALEQRHLVSTPLAKANVGITSIDQPIPGTDDLYLYETIAYEGEYADSDFTSSNLRTHLYSVLDKYPQRTKDILDGYFNLYNEYTNLHDIGKKYNMTGEGMRRIKNIVLGELKTELEYKYI
jgi:RNA polymerase sigma factor (sigma-70 family)